MNYEVHSYHLPPIHPSIYVKHEKYANANWKVNDQRQYPSLTILSPIGSTSSSFSSPLPSSCSTPSSASGSSGDVDNENNTRRKIRFISKHSHIADRYPNDHYGNHTSVKDYIKNKTNGYSNVSEYIDDGLEDFEASRSLLREMVPGYPENSGEFASREESGEHQTTINNSQYTIRGTSIQKHPTQGSNRYSSDSNVYVKPSNCKPIGMLGGLPQQTVASTSAQFTTVSGAGTTVAIASPSSSSSSGGYRMRARYSSSANSAYAADMYSSGASYGLDYGDADAVDGGGGAYDYGSSGMPAAMPPGGGVSDVNCAVCGDGHAKLHYGVLACYGCKGFFRRTLTGKYRYACRFGNNCVVDKYQRNSCRYCRFNRCLEVGMDPKAVRPDRDLTGKQRVPRARKRQIDEDLISHIIRLQSDDWSRKIPVEAKVLLMQLLNIESKVIKGDAFGGPQDADEEDLMFDDEEDHLKAIRRNRHQQPTREPSPPSVMDGTIKSVSLRELFEQKPILQGRRTEMCFEPYRMARPEELSQIAHRSALAAVDWIDALAEIGDFGADTEDKVALAKSCYAPLTIFNLSARTVQNTKDPDILCLNNHCYVPRRLPSEFNATTHLPNVLIDRMLNELVTTLRKLNLREEEVVPLKSIIILNPNCKGLSAEVQQRVSELRDRIQDMLFQIVKELHPAYNASSRFGNLLLILPTITTLSSVMNENMQCTQIFGGGVAGTEPLLNELFEDMVGGLRPARSSPDEPLITSTSTSALTPPLFENPADISIQTTTYGQNEPRTPSGAPGGTQKVDGSTQTEPSGHHQNLFHPSVFYQTQDASCTAHDSFSKNQILDDSLVGLSSFGSSFEDAGSLFDDCELVGSSTFSPEMAAQLFESTTDIFELMK